MLTMNLKNPTNPETMHVVMRMTVEEHQALHTYMHKAPGEAIDFPYGVKIVYRGRGWYKMVTSKPYRALEKLTFAMNVVRRFMKEQQQLLMVKKAQEKPPVWPMPRPSLVAVGQRQGFTYPDAQAGRRTLTEEVPLPLASASKLAALASKFQR